MDLCGHGESPAVSEPFTKAAEAIAELCNAQKKRVVLIGYGLGAFVALEALRYAPKLKRIIFISGAYELPYQSWFRKHPIFSFLQRLSVDRERFAKWIVTECRRVQNNRFAKARYDISDAIAYLAELETRSLREQAMAFRGKSLVIHGSEDALIAPSHGRALHRALKHSSHVELPENHLSIISQESTLLAIQDFIERT